MAYYGLGALPATPTQVAWDALAARFGQNIHAAQAWRVDVLQRLPTLGSDYERVWQSVESAYAQGLAKVNAAWAQAGIARGRSLEEGVAQAAIAVDMTVDFLNSLARVEAMWPGTFRQAFSLAGENLRVAIVKTRAMLGEMPCLPGMPPGVGPCKGDDNPYKTAITIATVGAVLVGGAMLIYVATPYLQAARAPGEAARTRTRARS